MSSETRILLVAAGVLLAAGCSVKEDRGGCPCVLFLDLEGLAEVVRPVDYPVRLRIEGEAYVHEEWLGEEDCTADHPVTVPAKRAKVWVVAGDGGLFDGGVAIPSGSEAPALVWWSGTADTSGETARVRVDPWKDYCRLTLRLGGAAAEDVPFSVALSGDVAGFSAPGEPQEGDFLFSPRLGTGRECVVLLPRQRNPTLRLDVLPSGGQPKSFALGVAIGETGYDWSRRILPDLTVDLDFAATRIGILSGTGGTSLEHEIIF